MVRQKKAADVERCVGDELMIISYEAATINALLTAQNFPKLVYESFFQRETLRSFCVASVSTPHTQNFREI